MNIKLKIDPTLTKQEIVISCKEESSKARHIYHYAKGFDNKISCKLANQLIHLHPKNIVYIESVDKKTFVYSNNEVYESELKLYQLEDQLSQINFFRASKNTIINLMEIKTVAPQLNRNLLITMSTGEQTILSRRNVKQFNETLERK